MKLEDSTIRTWVCLLAFAVTLSGVIHIMNADRIETLEEQMQVLTNKGTEDDG